ncbi:OmpP1/FadL family transporter [Thermopetrobacter sp. TC1]|uniref:OmpP1/FadL family transporter n=1 Tax=Thermopetrobacter sp. TC1 TaxID=1495045 RepID=UPI0018CF2B59|nr:outer membrane protein transport protein [Thermopetrobacter sp. TC1]
MVATGALHHKGKCIAALLFLSMGVFSANALAGGFAIHEQSAEFQGASFAGVAAGGTGFSGMFWNPAVVTLNPGGWRSDLNASAIIPYANARGQRTAAGTQPPTFTYNSGDIAKNALVTASYDTYRFNDRIWFGLAVTSPFGLKTHNPETTLAAQYGSKSKILTVNINPVIGYRVNDMLAVAAGLQIGYMKGDLSTHFNGGQLLSHVKGDDWGVGFTAGLLFTPFDGTRIGIGYRSRIKHTLKGHYSKVGLGTVSARVKHTLPDIATFSIRQDVTDNLRLLGTVEWTNWSLLEDFTVRYSGNQDSTRYDWKDGWLFAAGAEYDYSDALTFRLGYAYEISPVTDAHRGTRVPDNDRHWLSVGASWKADDWLTLHVGYSHLFVKDGRVAIDSSHPRTGLRATYKNHVNIIAVSATVDTSLFFSRIGSGG